MRGLFILLLFQLIGEFGNRVLFIPLPGPVLGMLLLLAALVTFKSAPWALVRDSKVLIRNMGMLFVPAATGFAYYLFRDTGQILPILLVATLGTLLAIIFTALLMQWLIKEEQTHEHH